MPLRLSFESGSLAGVNIVTSAPVVRLGRDPAQNDLVLTNLAVSRKHAVIERSERGEYTVEIFGTGPSKLNGDPIVAAEGRSTVHPLASGDRLDFGGVEFTVNEAEAHLIVVMGRLAGREINLDGPVRVGSGADCDLVIKERGVAEEHLVITATPLGFLAEARAPVTFNGTQEVRRILSDGDELVLGANVMRFTVKVALDRETPESSMGGGTLHPTAASNAVGELVFIAGGSKGERIPLGDNQIILGTRDDCTFNLADAIASPVHCAISKSGDQFIATDLGSEAGTYINTERIFKGTALKPGDLISIGMNVLQARLLGGVSVATKGKTIYTLMAGNILPQPRFVIDGRVVKAKRIVIGRAPSCDVILEGSTISREHCAIEWANGFIVRDSSSQGTYVDDKRIVQQHLPPSGVLRVVDVMFRVVVRGEVCTLERADAAHAQAAVDVAREHAARFQVADPRSAPQGGQGHRTIYQMNAGDVGGGALKTMFRMDAGAIAQEISAKKKEQRRGAPAWRPSSDLSRSRTLRGSVVVSVVAAIALCGGAAMFGRGKTLVNHPLSEAHSSAAFFAQSTGTLCASCHVAGARVDAARCESCHKAFAPRPAHHERSCDGCHREHQGASKDGSLSARAACAGCHDHQHAKEFAATEAPQRLAAGPLPDRQLDSLALHAAHSRLTVGGHDVGIGCTSCHARVENRALVAAKPGLACFNCHQGGETATKSGCERCHGREHAVAMTRMPPGDAGRLTTIKIPGPLGSIGWALCIAMLGGAPGVAFAAWIRLRRRKADSALVDAMEAHPAEIVKRLVHSINDSKCVGCGLCVQACPASVLELVDHKSRVVNFDACIQCKKCEQACAFDALRMHDADKPPPMIAVPSIDAFHETPVAGLFLIGQASGTAQVKNATNLGRAGIQRIVQQGFQAGGGRAAGCDVDIVIVGSGPAGLSAALTCIELGLSYVVLEKERECSWTIRNYYHKGKEVMAEPHDIALEATLPHWDTTREELLGAWQQMIDQYQVVLRYQHNVTDVKKDGERFTVHFATPQAKGQVTAARVVIAIGTLGNPRKLGCPGEDLEKVKNSLVDPGEWTGKNIMVVGGSDSAVEVVLALCAPERRNQVWFSTRGAKLEGIKPKNRKAIEDALAANRFKICYATTIAEVTPNAIALSHKEDGRREDLPNDVVFAMIGGNSPQKWLQQIGIPYVDKAHSWSPPRTDLLAQKTSDGLISVKRLMQRR